MYLALIQYLKKLNPDDIGKVDLEEIALIQALRDSYSSTSPEAQQLAFVSGLVTSWLTLDFKELTPAFNMRLQPLLRNALDALITKGVDALNPSQVHYLIAVGDILSKIKGTDKDNRLLKLFSQHEDALKDRLLDAPAGGLQDLHDVLRITTENEIAQAPRRNTKSFGGIELELNGPMLSHNGDLKVLDAVPNDSMITVDNGSCYVSGYVMGHVSATDRCEVRDNVAGTIIAGKGSINVRNVLTKARVISKWSDVVAQNTQDPELIFAGNKIHIHAKAMFGNYVAPVIQVDGEISGGEYTFSENCTAPKFSVPPARNLILELQDKISCDVYGGLVDPEAGRTIANIGKLENRHDHVMKMIKVIVTECEHFANNGILYLLGGDLIQTQIEEISRKQRRIAFLERIINGIDSLTRSARLQLIQQQRRRAQRQNPNHSASGMEELNDELIQIKSNTDLDADLTKEGEELHKLTQSLSRHDPIEFAALHKLDTKKDMWLIEKIKVQREIEGMENLIKKAIQQNDVMKAQGKVVNKMNLFNQILASTKGKSNQDPMLQRSRSNYIQFVIRTIDQRKRRMLNYRKLMDDLTQEHSTLSKKLKEKYNIEKSSDDEKTPSPVVKGVFDDNVIICTDKFLIDAPDSARDGLHFTDFSDDIRTYSIKNNIIVQLS